MLPIPIYRSATDAFSSVASFHGPGVPQEVAGLVTALQHLSAMGRGGLRRDTERGKMGDLPPEVLSAMSMLRQVRDSTAANKEESMHMSNKEQKASMPVQTEETEHTAHMPTCSRCGQPTYCATKDDIQKMETRVMAHVDQALEKLQRHLDFQMDKLTHSMESLTQRS